MASRRWRQRDGVTAHARSAAGGAEATPCRAPRPRVAVGRRLWVEPRAGPEQVAVRRRPSPAPVRRPVAGGAGGRSCPRRAPSLASCCLLLQSSSRGLVGGVLFLCVSHGRTGGTKDGKARPGGALLAALGIRLAPSLVLLWKWKPTHRGPPSLTPILFVWTRRTKSWNWNGLFPTTCYSTTVHVQPVSVNSDALEWRQ
jgi:hypothetical protein